MAQSLFPNKFSYFCTQFLKSDFAHAMYIYTTWCLKNDSEKHKQNKWCFINTCFERQLSQKNISDENNFGSPKA